MLTQSRSDGRLALLLIEDDADDALLIRELLGELPEASYEFQEASLLAEGERLVRERRFDAAVLDMTLPDSQGLKNVERLHAAAPALPIVVLTGRNDAALAAAAVRGGAQDYVIKGDFTGASLAQAIRHAIERKGLDELEALRKRDAMQRDFIANVSHEFRTPIAAIKGFTETLRMGAIEDADNRLEFVRIIERHAQRLSHLVEDLLRLSIMDSGGEKPLLDQLALQPFLAGFIKSIAPFAEKQEISLTLSCPPDLKAMADREQLEQALQKLCRNAMEYNRPGGRVTVTARRQGNEALVTVRDTGMGIASDELPHLFERFYRAGGAKRQKPEGTGLSLLIVKRIVEAHGGRIWAESKPGIGSILRFTLPIA